MDIVPSLQPSGDEIEQTLMDLGPLLGVTIKEEVLEDAQDSGSSRSNNIISLSSGEGSNDVPLPLPSKVDPQTPPEQATGADSLESPTDRANTWTTLKCVFCSQTLATLDNGIPKLMECLHSACEGCVKSKIEERTQGRDFLGAERITIPCTVCKIPCSPSNMIDQQYVVEKSSMEGASGSTGVGEQHCSSCSDENIATAWCVECSEFICDVCVQAHQRLKITKDHTIKSKDEATLETQASNNSPGAGYEMFCKEHTQERLSLFCETCDRLTCRDCQLLHHRDHKYQFSTEMATQARSSISTLLSEVSYKRVLLGSAMKVINDRQTLIADKKKALVHEITQTVVTLTNTINTRGKQLVLRLNEVCDAKQRTLNEKKQALEQLSAITDHCIQFVNAALEQGSDTAVLYSKKQVTQHLQRIKSKRADIPNPEIPVRIHLALDKVPDLIKVLSTIGGIVVDGKVDASGGQSGSSTPRPPSGGVAAGGQGPYHPPPAHASHPPPPSTSPAVNASAVAALQHAALQQQSYHAATSRQQPSPSHQPPPYSSAVQLNQLTPQQQQAAINQLSMMTGRQGIAGNSVLSALSAVQPPHGVSMSRGASASIVRHPHVTSTTHPHHMTGLNAELNLRGLLNQSGTYGAANHQQRNAAQQYARQNQQALHAYQAAAAASGAYGPNGPAGSYGVSGGGGGGRMPAPPPRHQRTPSPHQHAQHYHQHMQQAQQQAQQQQAQAQAHQAAQAAAAKWHIPQQHGNGLYEPYSQQPPQSPSQANLTNDSFKITLGRQPAMTRQHSGPSAVTSTNPKTPSPSLHGTVASDAAVSLDKLCQESVNDLMATIAKLDSNGVQVLAEAGGSNASSTGTSTKGASPHVHSSTDDGLMKQPNSVGAPVINSVGGEGAGGGGAGSGDPNEDWCAVCMDGGELMCCDKCPKVFHQYCHIPTIDKLPEETETWQCLLCVNFADLSPEVVIPGRVGLTSRQQKLIERIVLELYCQYESSLAFREPVPNDNVDYHSKIHNPMSLDMIRLKLQPGAPQRYTQLSQMVADVRLLFRNAYHYNPPDSQIYKDAKRLEEFFDQQLAKWLPEYAYFDPGQDESTSAKRAKMTPNGLE